MSGTTPNQGFLYPLVSDRPCDLPAALAQTAVALDLKAQGYDVDVARLATRKFVKISRSNFSYGQTGNDNINDVAFDTVEANKGTSTDLSIDPFTLRLSSGFWMITAKVIQPTNLAGQDFTIEVGLYDLNAVSKIANSLTVGRDYGSGITTLAIQSALYANPSDTIIRVALSYTIGNAIVDTISYASLSAWWISDI